MGDMKPTLSTAMEGEFVSYIQQMEAAMYALTTRYVRKLAYDVAVRASADTCFSANSELAGTDWLAAFMGRHPQLSIRSHMATSLARINGFNKEAVAHLSTIYRQVLEARGGISPTKIWNCDETGFTTVARPGNVVCTRGVRQVSKVSSGERGKNITALRCMSAAGKFIPPMFVFCTVLEMDESFCRDGWVQ